MLRVEVVADHPNAIHSGALLCSTLLIQTFHSVKSIAEQQSLGENVLNSILGGEACEFKVADCYCTSVDEVHMRPHQHQVTIYNGKVQKDRSAEGHFTRQDLKFVGFSKHTVYPEAWHRKNCLIRLSDCISVWEIWEGRIAGPLGLHIVSH